MHTCSPHAVVRFFTTVASCFVFAAAAAANDPQGAHGLAERFANAHKPPPPKAPAGDTIQASEVQGAVQSHTQEAELKSTDALLDSIEARTRAIEELLERTETNSWGAKVSQPGTPHAPTATEPEIPTQEVNKTGDATPTAKDSAATKDVFDLPQPTYALGRSAAELSGLAEASKLMTTATVLLKIEPGNKGIRRYKKTADPVLCGRRHCYMSQGTEKTALRVQRGATLGPFNTLGRRAGACRQKVTCVFRGIDVMDDGVLLQPIDLKLMRHDRRAFRSIKADPTCHVSGGRLHCANPIVAKTWTAWVVPEVIAKEAGTDGLETALQDGLPQTATPTIHVDRSKKN